MTRNPGDLIAEIQLIQGDTPDDFSAFYCPRVDDLTTEELIGMLLSLAGDLSGGAVLEAFQIGQEVLLMRAELGRG